MISLLKKSVPVLGSLSLALLMSAPVQAQSLGDTLKTTFDQNAFTYTAEATLELESGGELGIPFNTRLEVMERGGKQSQNYYQEGSMNLSMDQFSQFMLPATLRDLSMIEVSGDYQGLVIEDGESTYLQISNMMAKTDSTRLQRILNMFNEMMKFPDGKWMKYSNQALFSVLGNNPDLFDLSSEDQMILSNAANWSSLNELTGMIAEMADVLEASNVLVSTDSRQFGSTRSRGAFGQQERSIYRLATEISEIDAGTLKNGLGEVIGNMFPMFAEDINRELGSMSSAEFQEGINMMLEELQKLEFEMVTVSTDRRLLSLDIMADFSQLGLPLTLSETVSFDYRRGPEINIPVDGPDVIDFGVFFDGFVAMAEMSQSSFQQDIFAPSNSYSPNTLTPGYGGFGIDYQSQLEILQIMESFCSGETICMRGVAREMMTEIREMRQTGMLTSGQYQQALENVRSAMRR